MTRLQPLAPLEDGDEYLRVGYLKCFMDGTLGSQTALMTDGTGVEITSRAELRGNRPSRRRARLAGRRPRDRRPGEPERTRHLRGDEGAWEPKGLRHRIEHAQCLTLKDLPRFAELGIACVRCSSSHAPSDRDLADRLWADRLDSTYAFRALLGSVRWSRTGSDAPVEELDPLAGIAAGVLRSIDERPAWRPEQALTVEQALHATCVAPTFLSGDERRRGRLVPGLLADLVVLDRDPLAIEPEELRDVQVVATMVGGRWV